MEKKYRVSFVPAIEENFGTFVSYASSLKEARMILDALAFYTLYLHDKKLMYDYSNMGIIEVFEDCVWCEVDEDE